jgi:uncharacterized protein CbrC (UPF0167 family)
LEWSCGRSGCSAYLRSPRQDHPIRTSAADDRDTPISFPAFRYHPDPIASGSIQVDTQRCEICKKRRGYSYAGPLYSEIDAEPVICPWCIADGSAADALDCEFCDVGEEAPDEIPPEVLDAIATRTPGFSAWQQEHWLYHCDDAAAFLGPAGSDDLARFPDAVESLRLEQEKLGWSQDEVGAHLAYLDRESEPTAYLLVCLHCGKHLAYSDSP